MMKEEPGKGNGMNLGQTSRTLQLVHERYLQWREVRAELHGLPADERPSPVVEEQCEALFSTSIPGDRAGLLAAIDGLEASLKGRLAVARRENWYQQGKMLRYALVLVENRLASLEAGSDHATGDQGVVPIIEALKEQVRTLRTALGEWDDGPRQDRVRCSLEQIGQMIADPYHAADKEQLEAVVEQGRQLELPAERRCIVLAWDPISGALTEARLPSSQAHKAA